MFSKKKRAQLTLFIVLALVIVAAVILTFFIIKTIQLRIGEPIDPNVYMHQCVAESLQRNEEFLISENLYSNKTFNSIVYRGEIVPYLCSVSQYYSPCVNQQPMLLAYVERSLGDLVKPDAEKCLSSLFKMLKKRGYNINEIEGMNISISIKKGRVDAEIKKKFTASTENEAKTYENFASGIASPLYNLIDTTRSIINYESETCEFNYLAWMFYYRDVSISKFVASDGSKVYTLVDKTTGKSIKFAVKTCLFPAGI